MDVFAGILQSPIGILSLFTIAMVCVIAVTLFFWVKKQADKESKK